jgi:hypothetical protein
MWGKGERWISGSLMHQLLNDVIGANTVPTLQIKIWEKIVNDFADEKQVDRFGS